MTSNAVAMHQGSAPKYQVFPHFISVIPSCSQIKRVTSNVKTAVWRVGNHLLQLELLRELLVQLLQLGDELSAGLDDGGLGRDVAVGVDAELEGREKRVRDLVGGEGDVLHAVELVAEEVGERVVFFVESELSGVGDLCAQSVSGHGSVGCEVEGVDLRVTVSISTFLSPSASRNSSCLSGTSISAFTLVQVLP